MARLLQQPGGFSSHAMPVGEITAPVLTKSTYVEDRMSARSNAIFDLFAPYTGAPGELSVVNGEGVFYDTEDLSFGQEYGGDTRARCFTSFCGQDFQRGSNFIDVLKRFRPVGFAVTDEAIGTSDLRQANGFALAIGGALTTTNNGGKRIDPFDLVQLLPPHPDPVERELENKLRPSIVGIPNSKVTGVVRPYNPLESADLLFAAGRRVFYSTEDGSLSFSRIDPSSPQSKGVDHSSQIGLHFLKFLSVFLLQGIEVLEAAGLIEFPKDTLEWKDEGVYEEIVQSLENKRFAAMCSMKFGPGLDPEHQLWGAEAVENDDELEEISERRRTWMELAANLLGLVQAETPSGNWKREVSEELLTHIIGKAIHPQFKIYSDIENYSVYRYFLQQPNHKRTFSGMKGVDLDIGSVLSRAQNSSMQSLLGSVYSAKHVLDATVRAVSIKYSNPGEYVDVVA